MLRRSKGQNHEVLFHHRLSTSTEDVRNACHPFSTKNHFRNEYIGVHNGVLSNDMELEREHKKLGINYVSKQSTGEFNDSEALIYDIARYLEGEVDELTAQGSIAFVVIKRDEGGKPTTLFFGRNNGNPLVMKKTKHSITLSSTGEGDSIDTNTLYSFDYETGELTKRYMYIPYWGSSKYGVEYSKNYYAGPADDAYDDYMGYPTPIYKSSKTIIEAGNFVPRGGTYDDTKQEILIESDFDKKTAAVTALVEAGDAKREMRRIDLAIAQVNSTDVIEEIFEYYNAVEIYANMLSRISKEFESESEKPLEEVASLPGFQRVLQSANQRIEVSEEERSLLPVR